MVFVPSAPALVPDLSGPGADDVEAVRTAALDALKRVGSAPGGPATRWIACGSSIGGQPYSTPDGRGSFAAFGVDRRVGLDGYDGGDAADPSWPTSMLMAGWYREAAGLGALTPLVVDVDATVEQTVDLGASLRRRLDESDEPVALLVIGDGATSLSPRAPGGGDAPQAHDLQARIDAALGRADRAALTALPVAECDRWCVSGRAVWQVIAAALTDTPMTARLDYADAPLGVGYTVATWTAGP